MTLQNVRHASNGIKECTCKPRSATGATERSSLVLSFTTLSALVVPLTFVQHASHRFTALNKADPGLLSPDLHDLLHDFTQMEEMLCSLASPCFLMWVSKGGQYKARGNVITFSQDISHLCTTLPRLPEQLDILVVRRTDCTDSSTYKDFRVRKDKVFRLLRFLKEHNRFYSDITIRRPETVDLPDDGSILDRLPITEPREDNPLQPALPNRPPQSHTSDEEPVSQELAHEQNSFVPSLAPLPSEQDAITTAMNDSGLASTSDAPLPWPPTGPALSEYSTLGLFSMAFPTLFPLGLADISLRRDRKIELHEWVKHLMRYRDSRFATHPRFRFFALNIIFRHRSMQRGKYLFSRNISHHNMTIGQLREALSRHDGPHLAADIVRCLKTVKATRPYWNMEGGEITRHDQPDRNAYVLLHPVHGRHVLARPAQTHARQPFRAWSHSHPICSDSLSQRRHQPPHRRQLPCHETSPFDGHCPTAPRLRRQRSCVGFLVPFRVAGSRLR
jgi:hypothetical protein